MKKIFIKYYTDVKENPGKIFGFVYLYIFIIGFTLGIYYVNNLNNVARQTVPPGIPDSARQEDLKVVEAKNNPPVDLASIQNPGAEVINKGQAIYSSTCVSCHGETGQGNGPAAASLNPPPRNFTSKTGWKNGIKLSDIYKTLDEGIPGSGMISYNYMPAADRLALAQYVRTKFVQDAPPVTQDEISTLDQNYKLSSGSSVAAQIPVKNAMEIYISENNSRTEKVISSIRKLSESGSEGARIFNRVISDKSRALTTLMMQEEWMQDKNKLVALMTTGINRNGFNSEVYYLHENDWTTLHNFLVSIF